MQAVSDASGDLFHLSQGGPVEIIQRSLWRRHAVEIFLSKYHGAVHEVAEDGNQLVVVLGLEVFPGEVVVFGLRGIGC